MSLCGSIIDFTKDCDFPMHGGLESDILIIDWDDIQAELAETTPGLTFDSTNPALIDDFTFQAASGREGYLIQGNVNMIKAKSVPRRLETGVFFDHEVTFQVADNLAATDKIIRDLANKKVAFIVTAKHQGDGSTAKYKCFGIGRGMMLQDDGGIDYEAADGAYVLTFKSDALAPELEAEFTLFKTSVAVTTAIYTALQTPA